MLTINSEGPRFSQELYPWESAEFHEVGACSYGERKIPRTYDLLPPCPAARACKNTGYSDWQLKTTTITWRRNYLFFVILAKKIGEKTALKV